MTYSKSYCEEKEISISELNEAQRTLYYIAENLKMDNSISEEGYKHFQMAIKALEQEPQMLHCKNCKWWKDSDGEYRRDIGAESKCPINRKEVFEGNGYCYMFKPQESEDKEMKGD